MKKSQGRTKPKVPNPAQWEDFSSFPGFYGSPLGDKIYSPWESYSSNAPGEAFGFLGPSSTHTEDPSVVHQAETYEPDFGESTSNPPCVESLFDWQEDSMARHSNLPFRWPSFPMNAYTLPSDSGNSSSESGRQVDDQDSLSSYSTGSSMKRPTKDFQYLPVTAQERTRRPVLSRSTLCIPSENAAHGYARATMTQNLIRIYHDSLENALSCWLTEHNCPYSEKNNLLLPLGERKEWGANWSNRICIRICQLDRASSSIRNRALSAQEDKAAAQALHMAIIAFASQWTQHAQKGCSSSVPSPYNDAERSIRENVWNKARHALERSSEIPSFRIVFANIIFSLTQSPLNSQEDVPLGQLLETDRAPRFLEAANRQLFTFRHKLARLQRGAPVVLEGSRRESVSDIYQIPHASENSQSDSILSNQEHCDTFNLLFWLGVMFDTLTAAMYQRPLVVSDEDSQITSPSPAIGDTSDNLDIDGWNIRSEPISKKKDIWDDFFLRDSSELQSNRVQIKWPCSYEEAASILSEATPVKVLLYRRVTQLQTLVYRGIRPTDLETVIQRTILVYDYWNRTYQGFMLDCIANHEQLPPRIQSWYVILNGHWHLAAMLLADMIESIDGGRLGSDVERAVRQATGFVAKLKTENAFAVGALARSSLQGQDGTMSQYFHDSLNEVAFLVEPWTVVLIHSFAKAGYISLEQLDLLEEDNLLAECFRQNCEYCISALQYLGRKSDMASLVARSMSKSLKSKVHSVL